MVNVSLAEIGQRIHARRKQMGYTQEQIAAMMDVSIQMISNLERGNKAIRIDNLVNLCQLLEVSTDYILMGKVAPLDNGFLADDISKLSPRDRKLVETLVNTCLESE